MSGWLSGVVKAVNSGDCLTVMSQATKGPPPEKVITLSSLISPRLARQGPEGYDEPYAWEAREFLRRTCVGREVVFRVDYAVASIGREFGTVYVKQEAGGQENVSFGVVQNGLAKVRQGGGDQSPDIEQLLKLQENASEAGVGLWAKEPSPTAVRDIPTEPLDALALLETHKGKALAGIVEHVFTGSTVRMTLLPDFHSAVIFIAGIQCPSMGRRAVTNADGEETRSENAAEPYAREAKHFAECKVLHREVRVVLEGVDKYQNLFGTLYHPESGEPVDIAEQFCRLGLSKVVDWSAAMLGYKGVEKLRLGERAAKEQRLRIWRDYVPPPKSSNSMSDNFSGEVIEVVSGDMIVVKDHASKLERRICLSSIRGPKVGNPRRDIKPEPYGHEAKDFLRQRLVGKQVNVSMEYCRKIPLQVLEGAAPANNTMSFGAVTLAEETAGEGSQPNLAEMLVTRGLATVIRHRADEERAMNYDALMCAEAKAIKSKKGIHSAKEAPVNHVNDLSGREATQKARGFLPFLQRSGRVSAVVEVVLSGHRVKLYVPKENVTIAFSIAGVRAPGKTKEGVSEPFSDEALAFTRHRCLQRNVEVEVESVDKTGTFLGNLTCGKLRLGQTLLEAGLASLHPMFNIERSASGPELKQAEQKAKNARLKIWADYDPSKEAALEAEDGESGPKGPSAPSGEVWADVEVTEVKSGGVVYVQRKDKAAKVDWLANQMQSLGLKEAPATGGVAAAPVPGVVYAARFTEDNQWYRAKVEKEKSPAAGKVAVFYVDFGNSEEIAANRVVTLDAAPQLALMAQPALAEEIMLAGLKVPLLEEDFGYEAAQMLSMLTMGKKLSVRVEAREKSESKRSADVVLATLFDPSDTSALSVNEEMVKAGVARLVRPRNHRIGIVVDALKPYQDTARSTRANLWQYGDVDSDEDL